MSSKEKRQRAIELSTDKTKSEIAEILGVSIRTVQRYIENNVDMEPLTFKSIAAAQKLQDKSNIQTKVIRESARRFNAVEEMYLALTNTLKNHAFSSSKKNSVELFKHQPKVGVIQISDVHFNELIKDVDGNEYDFDIASARIKKLIDTSIQIFKAQNIRAVAVFLTGDLLNSDRRLDEITSAATNRSNAIFLAVDILQQAINSLLEHFDKVTIASITGNESRVGHDNHWGSFLAGDSYDIVIHNMLTILFKNDNRTHFVPVQNPLECVVRVLNTNFLLVHGHGHRGLARTANLESEVQNIKANYSAKNIKIDYVICGHIHQAYISDCFSRSSGLPGSNSYSSKALNLNGKASQNIYIVHEDGSIDGTKVCLQTFDKNNKYNYNTDLIAYQSSRNHNTIIQSVLI